jgi:hypothetical protein
VAPHNFGSQVDDNIALLRTIMERYRALSEMQGMTSRIMGEIAAAARQLERAAQPAEAPPAPRLEVVEAAQVSATAP